MRDSVGKFFSTNQVECSVHIEVGFAKVTGWAEPKVKTASDS